LVTVLGILGFLLGGGMLYLFMFDARLGLTSALAYQVVFGILIASGIWYFVAKNAQKSKGINVDYAFKEIPPE
jgi:hypothetical protein